jgi:hypothetical protein
VEVIGNIKYVTGVTEYVVDNNDGTINVDTSVNAVTIILPNILGSGYYGTAKGFIINDISDNASVNNIIIVAADNTINSTSSVSITQNGGTAKCSIANQNEWFIVREPESFNGSEWIETIVNISSSQILNMGTTPIELLPASGVNKYYDIEKIILEFTYGTVPYSDPDEPLRIIGNGADVYISREIIISEQNLASISTDTQLKIQNNGPDSYVYRRVIPSNEALFMIINGGVDVTNGDGTMRAIIKYKIRTFGE